MSSHFEHDDTEFEERISSMLNSGTVRAISTADVIHGARRRRARHRVTVAGSSLAVVGVAAAAVALGGGGAKPGLTAAAGTGTTSSAATTCSAAVTGSTPAPDTHTDAQGQEWDTIGTGTAAGVPWTIQVHVYADKQSYADAQPTGSVPSQAIDALHPGREAEFVQVGQPGWETLGTPEGGGGDFFSTAARGLNSAPGTTVAATYKGWVLDPRVDHMCVQYKTHAEFLPVVHVQGAEFAAFAAAHDDQPQEIVGYGADGQVVGTMQGVSLHTGVYDHPSAPPTGK